MSKLDGSTKSIAQHLKVLNGEVGRLDGLYKKLFINQDDIKKDVSLMKSNISIIKTDLCWIKKIGYFISATIIISIVRVVFFS